MVSSLALNLLDEAADDKMNLEAMVCVLQNRDLDHLGTRGQLLKTRFVLSSTFGVKLLNNDDNLNAMFQLWTNGLNEEYVVMVENLINDGLTRHQRDDDLKYGRRTHEAYSIRPVFVPHHLYGQLAASKVCNFGQPGVRYFDLHSKYRLGCLAKTLDPFIYAQT
jgi:hypothetical protein